ncbi:hypothetical protein PtA15_9A42 [Puccinia triticina]|uniref:Uncharacterized protein n=1 Tax=Puccinia triticina TaxID=208348 RepID=A0ABY7CSL3_9BASI|nr:uncharacterized protein PtA15_9A42 [Puccinia triticina]WAQ87918.1 hypothetical protein PtA15_9A42 [Puccinia triticina]
MDMLELSTIAFVVPSIAAEVNLMPEATRRLNLRTNFNYWHIVHPESPPIARPDLPTCEITVDVGTRRVPNDGG